MKMFELIYALESGRVSIHAALMTGRGFSMSFEPMQCIADNTLKPNRRPNAVWLSGCLLDRSICVRKGYLSYSVRSSQCPENPAGVP
jgi:hypothetical protein